MDAKTFTGETHPEVECRFGLRGTPPTLDCLVDAPAVLAAESKCTETFSPDVARFSDAYDAAFVWRLRSGARSTTGSSSTQPISTPRCRPTSQALPWPPGAIPRSAGHARLPLLGARERTRNSGVLHPFGRAGRVPALLSLFAHCDSQHGAGETARARSLRQSCAAVWRRVVCGLSGVLRSAFRL